MTDEQMADLLEQINDALDALLSALAGRTGDPGGQEAVQRMRERVEKYKG